MAPWVSIEIDPSGWVYGCCANQLYPLGRIGHDRLSDLWGGPRAQVLRDALSRWDMSVGCGACQWHLEHGRMDPDAAVYDRYPVAGEDPPGPVAMTFALSNRCNLGCVMCTPELSSTLRHRAGLAPLRSPFDDQFYEDLATFLPGLQYAKFLGGEPFLIPEHHRVWDLIDEMGGPSRMQVTTNGTVWNDRVAYLLERFRFDVTISIDGTTSATYESIRSGASFDAVCANIDRFKAACEKADTELRFCFCLMESNAHELASMVRWTEELGAALSINVVTDLGHALHDLELDGLESVRRMWEQQEAEDAFGANSSVWRSQVEQLDAVIAERRQGVPPPARQAIAAGPDLLSPPVASGVAPTWSVWSDDRPEVDAERDRLSAWSGGGEVAEIRCGQSGTMIEVATGHRRLGLDDALAGASIGSLVEVISRVDGRPAWVLGVDRLAEGRTVRTIILCASSPVRGTAGSVVRIISLPASDGFVTLLAEDRIYDGPGSVAVDAPVVRP